MPSAIGKHRSMLQERNREVEMPEQLELSIDPPLVRTHRTGARKFAPETVARVLEARGNIRETARRLKCAPDTIRKAIREHDSCRKAQDDAQASAAARRRGR